MSTEPSESAEDAWTAYSLTTLPSDWSRATSLERLELGDADDPRAMYHLLLESITKLPPAATTVVAGAEVASGGMWAEARALELPPFLR